MGFSFDTINYTLLQSIYGKMIEVGGKEMTIKRIKGNTYVIETSLSLIPFYKVSQSEIILLDTGWADGEREGLEKLLVEYKLEIVGIICTHFHIDHAGNMRYFKDQYKIPVAMPAFEARLMESPEHIKVYYQGQNVDEVDKHYGHMCTTVDQAIEADQTSCVIAGIQFDIIHVPGHSPAQMAIGTPDRVLYVGDALVGEKILKSSKLPYAFLLSQSMASMEKLRSTDYDFYIVSHRNVYESISDVIDHNLSYYHEKSMNVLKLIDEPLTKEAIMKKVIDEWRIHVNSVNKYLVINNMLSSYLDYLVEKGYACLALSEGYLKYSKIDQ